MTSDANSKVKMSLTHNFKASRTPHIFYLKLIYMGDPDCGLQLRLCCLFLVCKYIVICIYICLCNLLHVAHTEMQHYALLACETIRSPSTKIIRSSMLSNKAICSYRAISMFCFKCYKHVVLQAS